MRGNITRRGNSSWRLKFEAGPRDPITGKRKLFTATVRGRRQDAEKELTRLLAGGDAGTLVDPSKVTIAEMLRAWLGGVHGLSPKTAERYGELAERQIIRHLGGIAAQKLKPAQIKAWHDLLLRNGGADGRPLHPRTVGHAHRVLHRALELAVTAETLSRNVASIISPPKVDAQPVDILDADGVAAILDGLQGHSLHPVAMLAIGSGMRRGELLALQWGDIDFDGASLTVQRSLEETKAGLRLKAPKTKHGRRTITLPSSTLDVLRAHWLKRVELNLALGTGKPEPEAFVFAAVDGSPLSPDNLSRDWRLACKSRNLPLVRFHALRHTSASALIASGLDVVSVSRRLGHGSPVITLGVYAHAFAKTDKAAADVLDATLRTNPKR